MKKTNNKPTEVGNGKTEKENEEAYPLYSSEDDIYAKSKDELNIDPEDIHRTKSKNADDKFGKENELDFKEDLSGDDLDVPGSELDDAQESIGSEDEENNFYSLGGDAHSNLDEDNGG